MGRARIEMIHLVLSLIFIEEIACDPLVVQTTSGPIRGKMISTPNGRDLRVWLGVPYAEPPLHSLRFMETVPVNKWTGMKETKEQPKACHQSDDSGYGVLPTFSKWNPSGPKSEDCLYLNIYAPKEKMERFSTIVWIHGGAFYKGSISLDLYNPEMLAATQGVIVIQIQYRLGAFGFLNFGKHEIPGNMGLRDQAEALRWIHANIAKFSGNPNDITLMGESAGSASVGYHMMSNLTKNLFQKAIMQSGSPFNYWAYIPQREAIHRSILFAKYAGCAGEYEERNECLRKKTADEIIKADQSSLQLEPSTDNKYMSKSPAEELRDGNIAKIPVLAGLVSNEGMPGLIYFLNKVFTIDYNAFTEENYNNFLQLLAFFLNVSYESMKKLGQFYLKEYSDSIMAAEQLFGDFFIGCPAIDFLAQVSETNPLYFYYFNYRSSMDLDPLYTKVMHGSEIQYHFGRPYRYKKEYNDEDRAFSKTFMDIWGKFVKTSNPKDGWGKYNSKTTEVFVIGSAKNKPVKREKFCNEWRKLKIRYDKTIDADQIQFFTQNAVALGGGPVLSGIGKVFKGPAQKVPF